MIKAVYQCLNLTEESISFLRCVEQQMGIVADLSRADLLLYGRKSQSENIVLSHARPHSLAHVYMKSREGRVTTRDTRPEVMRTLITGKPKKAERSSIREGAPVVRQTLPIFYPPPFSSSSTQTGHKTPKVIAALVIVTNLIEYERHRLRSPVFQRVLKKLQMMLLYGQLHGAEALSPFKEQDGILFTDMDGIIRYASGIATNLYRRLGYKETLIGRPLSALETEDAEIWKEAMTNYRILEQETEEANRIWIRKVIPLVSYPAAHWHWLERFNIKAHERKYGIIITLHDETDIRRQDEELRVKNAMIQEVHHRVKNNLQTIAGLLRMQARRVKSEEARLVLDETLNRILSVAVIHEFLSNENSNIINIKEVSYRIIAQFEQGVLSPDKQIKLKLTGEMINLPARQATACSLIINELLQNAIEHGFEEKHSGTVELNLADKGDEVMITVSDNGDGLPGDFHVDQSGSLGLQIVKILVEGDLRGKIQWENAAHNGGEGLSVIITFPKTIFRGEQSWNEHVSL